MANRFRIGVVGGSVAGCAVAVALSSAGHEVTVFERSATALASQGAGIIAPAEVFQGMVARRLLPEDYARCSVTVARYACRDHDQRAGRWLGDAGFNLTTVGWADLFHHLRGQVPSGAYRSGVTFHGLADNDDAGLVTLKTSDGMSGPFDLIAFADGYRSLGRGIVAPGAELRYRGLVFWRADIRGRRRHRPPGRGGHPCHLSRRARGRLPHPARPRGGRSPRPDSHVGLLPAGNRR